MTLYSKWGTGKNITFIASVVMLLCLVFGWVTMSKDYHELGMSMPEFKAYLKEILEWSEDKEIAAALRALNANSWRWILLLPMAYPVYTLFASNYKKDIACISALVTVVVTIILMIVGFRYLNFWFWLFFIASLAAFAGTAISANGDKIPAAATAGDANTAAQPAAPAEVFCPHCGAKNAAGAAFCVGCGGSLKQ